MFKFKFLRGFISARIINLAGIQGASAEKANSLVSSIIIHHWERGQNLTIEKLNYGGRMFSSKTYIDRINELKKIMKNGILFFPGALETPMNYRANTYKFR